MEFIRSSLKKYRHYYRGVRDKAVRRGDSELDSTWWWFSASDSGSWTASCQRWLCDAETIACPPGEAGKLTPARPGLLLVPPPHLFIFSEGEGVQVRLSSGTSLRQMGSSSLASQCMCQSVISLSRSLNFFFTSLWLISTPLDRLAGISMNEFLLMSHMKLMELQ